MKRAVLNRLRPYMEPLEADLLHLSREIELAQRHIQRCSLCLLKVEASGSGSVNSALSQSDVSAEEAALQTTAALAAKRVSLERLCGEARFEEAISQAIDWDETLAMHRRIPTGDGTAALLVEWLCDHILTCGLREEELLTPEAFLVQDPAPLPSNLLKLSLMAALLAGCTWSHTSLERLGQNLDWVFSLACECEATASVEHFFTMNAGAMTSTLSDLIQCRSPPSLAAAGATASRGLVRTSRMVFKQLALLQPMPR